VRVLHIGLIAALLAWAAPAVSQTMREHGLGGRGFTAPGSIRKAGRPMRARLSNAASA